MGDAAAIKGIEWFNNDPVSDRLREVALMTGVRSMSVCNAHEPTSRVERRGTLKYVQPMDGGIVIKAYGQVVCRKVFVYCEAGLSGHIASIVQSMGKRKP